MNWTLASLVFPALIELTKKYRSFLVFGKIKGHVENFKERPFVGFKKAFIPVLLLCMILPSRGIYPKFDYDFSHSDYHPNTAKADSLLRETNYLNYDPIVVILPNSKTARSFYNRINRERESNPNSGIRAVAIYQNLLPSNQQEKLSLLTEIKNELDPSVLRALSPTDSARIEKIVKDWKAAPVLSKDLPMNLRKLFGANAGGSTEYAFIFPNFNSNDGLACRRLAKELEPFHYDGNRSRPRIRFEHDASAFPQGDSFRHCLRLPFDLPFLQEILLFAFHSCFSDYRLLLAFGSFEILGYPAYRI